VSVGRQRVLACHNDVVFSIGVKNRRVKDRLAILQIDLWSKRPSSYGSWLALLSVRNIKCRVDKITNSSTGCLIFITDGREACYPRGNVLPIGLW
jgi:hypothetical protein